VPHRWLRRLLIAPLVLLATVFVLISMPLILVAAAIASPWVPGRWRPLRILCVGIVYLLLEVFALLALFLLWVISGFGLWMDRPWFIEAHYRLLGWVLSLLVGTARRAFNLRIDSEIDIRSESDQAPLLVLCRHAGPGDSFLLIHDLLANEGRRPRIVLKDSMQWDPMIDIVLNRLPTQFVSSGGGNPKEVVEAIGELAAGLGKRDSLVIFPEGGNYTDRRRRRSIAKLEERGELVLAERARSMRNVIAPRPGGTVAAIDNAPDDTVVALVAHTGLEDLSSAVDLWRGLPMDTALRSESWEVPVSEIPSGLDQQVDWLFAQFELIDDWIQTQHEQTC
jgi:1-acyl-sn-glycerol-3-phosphate acyltransferase